MWLRGDMVDGGGNFKEATTGQVTMMGLVIMEMEEPATVVE